MCHHNVAAKFILLLVALVTRTDTTLLLRGVRYPAAGSNEDVRTDSLRGSKPGNIWDPPVALQYFALWVLWE
jgi:hypothetical protein